MLRVVSRFWVFLLSRDLGGGKGPRLYISQLTTGTSLISIPMNTLGFWNGVFPGVLYPPVGCPQTGPGPLIFWEQPSLCLSILGESFSSLREALLHVSSSQTWSSSFRSILMAFTSMPDSSAPEETSDPFLWGREGFSNRIPRKCREHCHSSVPTVSKWGPGIQWGRVTQALSGVPRGQSCFHKTDALFTHPHSLVSVQWDFPDVTETE